MESQGGSVSVGTRAEKTPLKRPRQTGSAACRRTDADDFADAMSNTGRPWTGSGQRVLQTGVDVCSTAFIKQQLPGRLAALLGQHPSSRSGSSAQTWFVGMPEPCLPQQHAEAAQGAATQRQDSPTAADAAAAASAVRLQDVTVYALPGGSGGRGRFLPANDPTVKKKQGVKYHVDATVAVHHAELPPGSAAQASSVFASQNRTAFMQIVSSLCHVSTPPLPRGSCGRRRPCMWRFPAWSGSKARHVRASGCIRSSWSAKRSRGQRRRASASSGCTLRRRCRRRRRRRRRGCRCRLRSRTKSAVVVLEWSY